MGILRAFVRARLGRGLLAGSPFWIAVGAVVAARRLLRVIAPRTEVVYREKLDPGHGIEITHLTDRP